jgi:hypothetical protein
MKYLILAIPIFISCTNDLNDKQSKPTDASGLENKDDRFSDYSYLIYGYNADRQRATGTGYFYSYKGQSYFITAGHCVTGWDPISYKFDSSWPDNLKICLKTKSGHFREYSVNAKPYKESTIPFHIHEKPDIFITKIDNASIFDINYVNNFCERKNFQAYDSVLSFGFPAVYVDDFSISELCKILSIKQTGHLRGKYSDLNRTHVPGKFDSMYFQCNYISGIYDKGRSGSPVFKLSDDGMYCFAGMFAAGSPSTKRVWVLKPDFIIKEIHKVANKK